MFRTVLSDVSATELGILLSSKGALTPNGDAKRAIRHKSHIKRKFAPALSRGLIGAQIRAWT